MIQAVGDELDKIYKSKKTITLFEGKLIAQKGEDFIYKFELPEGSSIGGQIEDCELIIGNEAVEGQILSIDNQFITLKTPVNLGGFITVITIEWSSDIILRKLLDRLITIDANPDDYNLELTDSLFHPIKAKVLKKPNATTIKFDKERNEAQRDAIQGSLSNHISFIWGPPGTGKTSTLGFIAYNLIKQGKRILFATNTNRAVDVSLIQVIDAYKKLGKSDEFVNDITRYGRPFILNNEELDSVFFENQIENIKKQLREKIKVELKLYREFREHKIIMSQNQKYLTDYKNKKKEIQSNTQVLNTALIELKGIKDKIDNYDNVGFLGSLSRVFLGDSLDTLNGLFEQKKKHITKLNKSLVQIKIQYDELINEYPIVKVALERFEELKKQVDNFGGEKKLQKFVDEALAVDEISILKKKKFIAATLAKMVTNDIFFELECDVLIIDEASMVSLPYLAILSSIVKNKVIIIGDPQQLPPISLSESAMAKRWLEKDIYMYASNSIVIEDLFDWNKANKEYTHFLDTQYRMTGELSQIISDLFYKGNLKNGNNVSNGGLEGICFIDTAPLHPELKHLPGRKRWAPYNVTHTERIIEVLKYLAMEGHFKPEEIGVVLPLNASVQYVRKELRKNELSTVEVGSVYTFQGREKNFIIFDTVMTGVNYTIRPFDEGKTGEKVKRLLNVAISRPKQLLFVIANYDHFSSQYNGKFITKLLTTLKEHSLSSLQIESNASNYEELTPKQQQELLSEILDENTEIQKTMIKKKKPQKLSKTEKLITKEIQKIGREIDSLRFDINSESGKQNSKILFKPSTECEKIKNKLPVFRVNDEDSFKTWIDMLYKYCYESSGGKNAQYPIIDKNDRKSKVRWEINRFRNYFFHDVEFSVDPQLEEKRIEKIFKTMIPSGFPKENSEWSNVQLAIMNRIIEWLESVLEKL
jgi:hypothetical protein